jgi:hypothetical protein
LGAPAAASHGQISFFYCFGSHFSASLPGISPFLKTSSRFVTVAALAFPASRKRLFVKTLPWLNPVKQKNPRLIRGISVSNIALCYYPIRHIVQARSFCRKSAACTLTGLNVSHGQLFSSAFFPAVSIYNSLGAKTLCFAIDIVSRLLMHQKTAFPIQRII